jgi:HD-like signal output (HDOD) protein
VKLLGVATVRSLALSIHAFSCFDKAKLGSISFEALWSHSLRTAQFAQKIAKIEGMNTGLADESFISGLLHDLGRMMLLANMPDQYAKVWQLTQTQQTSLLEAERDVFGATHADVGAYLLGLWGLPVPIVEAVALHHDPRPNVSRDFSPLTAVHAANAIDHSSSTYAVTSVDSSLDSKYMAELGLEDRVPVWEETLARQAGSTDSEESDFSMSAAV